MTEFEQSGEFYLGKILDQNNMTETNSPYVLQAQDLTTHALCVGMTGSGKTGLAINLLEEAVLDNVPALVIDPKGDMANLFLTFPNLEAQDFSKWISAEEVKQSGLDRETYARNVAQLWQTGLASYGIGKERLENYVNKASIELYTPGSSAGKSLSIVDLLDKPSEAIISDPELLHDYVAASVSNLLALVQIDADPLTSKEHILLSNILLNKYKNDESVELGELIQLIQEPGLEKLGVLPLEQFFPRAERFKLAMLFNNLLAAPGFSTWFEGETLDIDKLLYTPSGEAKISIISINHLAEQERMFIVTLILNKLLAWMRSQSGTSSLRAILYMDEIFGFFPPVSNPPTKKPLLTLLKQARAFGLAVVLASQNPVDLDYKGLGNIGIWFIGRLQTEQDKARLMEGLQIASNYNEGGLNVTAVSKQDLASLLSNLPKRCFLVNNVHANKLAVFKTRWTMSYLAGPLTRKQINQLEATPVYQAAAQRRARTNSFRQDDGADDINVNAASGNSANADAANVNNVNANNANEQISKSTYPASLASDSTIDSARPTARDLAQTADTRAVSEFPPKLAKGIESYYYPISAAEQNNLTEVYYLGTIFAFVDTIYKNNKYGLAFVEASTWNSPFSEQALVVDWSKSTGLDLQDKQLLNAAEQSANYVNLPEAVQLKTNFTQWEKDLKNYIYIVMRKLNYYITKRLI